MLFTDLVLITTNVCRVIESTESGFRRVIYGRRKSRSLARRREGENGIECCPTKTVAMSRPRVKNNSFKKRIQRSWIGFFSLGYFYRGVFFQTRVSSRPELNYKKNTVCRTQRRSRGVISPSIVAAAGCLLIACDGGLRPGPQLSSIIYFARDNSSGATINHESAAVASRTFRKNNNTGRRWENKIIRTLWPALAVGHCR